jgi:hypothetical protein
MAMKAKSPAMAAIAGDGAMKTTSSSVESSSPIIDLIDHVIPDAHNSNFEGDAMKQLLDLLIRVDRHQEHRIVKDVLLIGGSWMDISLTLQRFPDANITAVNLESSYLNNIQTEHPEKVQSGQLRLFRADAQKLSAYKDKAGERYFLDESFDLIAAPGVNRSGFQTNGTSVLMKIAEQEVRLLRQGGLILHHYDIEYDEAIKFQESALESGVLKDVSPIRSWAAYLKMPMATDRNVAINAGKPNTGGIDLTSNKFLQTQNTGEGIKFQLNPAMLKQLQNAPGFYPVIINIQPMTNLKQFLGITYASSAVQSG